MKARCCLHLHMPGFECSPHLHSIILMLPDCILLFPGQGQHNSACSALYSVLPLYPGSSRQVSNSRGRRLLNSAGNIPHQPLKRSQLDISSSHWFQPPAESGLTFGESLDMVGNGWDEKRSERKRFEALGSDSKGRKLKWR